MNLAIVEAVVDKFRATIWGPAEALPPGRPRVEEVFRRWLHWDETDWADTGCPVMALSVELDDQPGPLKEVLKQRLQLFRKSVVGEFRLLRDPPLSEAEAQAAYFQMKSFILGLSDARRMMGDQDAERSAIAAFEALLDRTAFYPTSGGQPFDTGSPTNSRCSITTHCLDQPVVTATA